MPSRKPHTNSHHGCLQCKRRKVKCDEERPACRRCQRRAQYCSFLGDAGSGIQFSIPAQVLDTPPPTSQSGTEDGVANEVLHRHHSPPSSDTNVTPNFTLQDLELLHHFCTKSFLTIALRAETQVVWRETAIKHSFRHHFLLCGILAMAAFHKARDVSLPEQDRSAYRKAGLKYQTVALAEFIPELSTPTRDNCPSLLLFSIVLMILTLASSPLMNETATHNHPDLKSSTTDGAPDLLQTSALHHYVNLVKLLQGINSVVMQTKDWLAASDVATLIHRGASEPKIQPDDTCTHEALESFDRLEEELARRFDYTLDVQVDTQQELMAARHAPDNSEAKMYWLEILVLRRYLVMRPLRRFPLDELQDGAHRAEAAMAWGTRAPKMFNQSCEEERPMALAILAHSAACMQRLNGLWWIEGWPARFVAELSGKLDDSWGEVLSWPRRRVGLS